MPAGEGFWRVQQIRPEITADCAMSDANTTFLSRRWSRFLALMGLFTVLGLLDAAQVYMHVQRFSGNAIHWEEAIAVGLGDWYLWAAFTPIIFYLARRFPVTAAHWLPMVLIHVYFGTLIVLMKIALDMLLNFAVIGKSVMFLPLTAEERLKPNFEYLIPLFRSFIFGKIYIYPILYAAMVAASHFLGYYEKYRERELQSLRLETKLAQAQLQVLRMQLQPHFLFNTLNAIAALMHKDVKQADRMIARLGELLRATLENPGTQECSLRQELSFLRPYLEIEQARFGPRLQVTIDAPAELLDARLPYLLVQPLVENAIRHGIAPRIGPGRLTIRAAHRDDNLVIEVADNGVGLKESDSAREGIGIANTRARLRGLYGDAGTLVLQLGPESGVLATVSLPYREVAADDAGELVAEPVIATSPSRPSGQSQEAINESAGARR
jgi:two-component system, LytTR family, sensor kinase